jgi:hypothetical protein
MYKSTLARNIIFEGRRASGVAVETVDTPYLLKARKEIIVSSGVVCSNFIQFRYVR